MCHIKMHDAIHEATAQNNGTRPVKIVKINVNQSLAISNFCHLQK